MAIAVFSDIHGNLEALEAILADIKKRRIKEIFFLGDAITFGPDSSACLKLLQKYNARCVIGNHEQRIIRYDKSISEMSNAGIKHMEYIYNGLDNDDLRFIKSMPLSIDFDYKNYKLFFAHYAFDEKGVVLEDYDNFREDLLDRYFEKSDSDVVFYGHLHERKLFIRQIGRSYFNLGSSGCVPSDKTFYTYFDIGEMMNENNFDIYRIDVKWNRKKFVQKMQDAPIPEKAKFAKRYFNIELLDEHVEDEAE